MAEVSRGPILSMADPDSTGVIMQFVVGPALTTRSEHPGRPVGTAGTSHPYQPTFGNS